MKYIILLVIFGIIFSALYQKWRSIPPQTKQMWGALFGMAGALRQAKKQMREQGGVNPHNAGANPFEQVFQTTTVSSLMLGCAKCGLHVPENEGVNVRGQFYCCQEHAQ